jgi:hypothetical protein
LARLKKCIFTNNESVEASVEVAHYGDGPISNCTADWKIADSAGKVIQTGKFTETDIPVGNCFKLGDVSVPLAIFTKPSKLRFEVVLNNGSNSWDFWVYPAMKEAISGEGDIRVIQQLDNTTAQFIENGGSVLLNLKQGTLSKEMGGNIKTGFSSIFWNTAWTNGQGPHTLGILCNPQHPALAEFPTEYHSNWQWWDAMSHSGAIDLTTFPSGIKPIVRVIDDWFTNRPLALLFEARVGKGKILVSGIDLTQNLDKRPEAQQLLYSLKKYMAGNIFAPANQIELRSLTALTK